MALGHDDAVFGNHIGRTGEHTSRRSHQDNSDKGPLVYKGQRIVSIDRRHITDGTSATVGRQVAVCKSYPG